MGTMLQLTFALLSLQLAAAVFYHELSAIHLKGGNNTSFGFSLGYQKGNDAKLVVGAPRFSHKGRVSQCSIRDIDNKIDQTAESKCNPVTVSFDKLRVNTTLNPDQYFYLGASIAATEKGFVTCAPLRTTNEVIDREHKYDAFGVCFSYDNTAKVAKPWDLHSDFSDNLLEGGGGWSTLVDEKHDRIMISQFFLSRNSVYANISNTGHYERLFKKGYKNDLDKITIYGQAMTFGNYFEQDKTKTYYAFSMKSLRNTGAIDFFSCDNFTYITRLEDEVVGSMFGAALGSADVTGDGRDELLVGAPAQVDDANSCDRGAVHVYTFTSVYSGEIELILTIWGLNDGGRFGTTMVTNDVNGDSYSEIIVSAPFEKSGGALYILCGYEIHKLVAAREPYQPLVIFMSQLTRRQRIQGSYSFGLSLQPIADFNDNGSDELGVGSPEESSVTLYRGVRAVTVNVTSEFKNDATATNTDFVFSSCVTVKLPPKPKEISTKLLVRNVLMGEKASFVGVNATYELNFQTKAKDLGNNLFEYCEDFNIVSPLSCTVNTTVSLMENIRKEKEFKKTWVTLSAQSKLTKTTKPSCKCVGACKPDYTLDLKWSGKNSSDHVYVVGTSGQEMATIVVRNNGTMGCDGCATVRLSGTIAHTLSCHEDKKREYKCELPTPFRAGTNKTIDIGLMTNSLSNQDRNLTIDVSLYKDCNKSEPVNSSLRVTYDFRKVLEKVIIDGSSMNRTISDTELQDKTEDTLSVEQTFTILNNQSFKWNNVWTRIDTVNQPYIQDLKVKMKQSRQSCVQSQDNAHRHWKCSINLAQNSMTEIIVSTKMSKNELAHFLRGGNSDIMVSQLKLELFPDEIKNKTLVAQVIYEREPASQNNTAVTIIIAFIVALVVLLIIGLILYKLNFFKRKNKRDLEELRKEMRNRSMRSVTSKTSGAQPVAEPAPTRDSDTVDLIVDETPFDNSLSPAQLNCLAANPELTPKAVLTPMPEPSPKSDPEQKSELAPKSEVTPKSDVATKSELPPKSELAGKDEKETHAHTE